jgi:hypothetical protein
MVAPAVHGSMSFIDGLVVTWVWRHRLPIDRRRRHWQVEVTAVVGPFGRV